MYGEVTDHRHGSPINATPQANQFRHFSTTYRDANHRRNEKLPTSPVHEMLLAHRSIIELLGICKSVTERLEVNKTSIRFETTIVGSKEIDGKRVMGDGDKRTQSV